MAKDTKNESLDAITRALKYLRVNPELLVRPGIAVQLDSIGNMLTAIVNMDKENRASIRSKKPKAKLTERATSTERAAVERTVKRKQAQAERNAMRRLARAQARKEKLLNTPPRDYSNASMSNLRSTYYYYVSHGLPLPPTLEKQLARKFPGYNLKQHKFMGKSGRKPKPVSDKEPVRTPKKHAPKKVIDKNKPLQPSGMILTPMSKTSGTDKQVESAPKKINTPAMPQSADTVISTQVLNVRLKPVKVDMDKTYYDVYVNGRRIVKNNINTTVETFLGGTVLGIHGTPGADASPGAREIWQVFSTNLDERPNLVMDQFTKQRPYIVNIAVGQKEIILTDNKRVKYILDLKRYQKRAQGKIFQIKNENQK